MIFEKIRERLQKKKQSYMDEYGMIDIKIQEVFVEIRNIINQVEAEYNNNMVYQLAMKYALCLTQYGVDITGKLETATQNAMALEQAYIRGRQDECDKFSERRDRHNNGWIKCEGKTFAVGCKYIIVDKDNDIYIATYLNDNVFIARDKNYFMPIRLEATYCQLLPLPPQPPKGE